MNPTLTKICTDCEKEKSLDCFGKNKREKDAHHYYCKECVTNMNEENKEEKRIYFKEYREKNREKLKTYQKQYRLTYLTSDDFELEFTIEEKREIKRKKEKERRQDPEYKIRRQFYFKEKYKTDIQFKLKKQFEAKLNQLLRDNDTTEISQTLIGCTIPEFKAYLEAKWAPGMSWSNYGKEWNLDRIKPFCEHDLTKSEEAKLCFLYTNVQPLFIQTKIIDGVQYLGNTNKNKY